MKNTDYSFSIESIIITTYILGNRAPQIRTYKETHNSELGLFKKMCTVLLCFQDKILTQESQTIYFIRYKIFFGRFASSDCDIIFSRWNFI